MKSNAQRAFTYYFALSGLLFLALLLIGVAVSVVFGREESNLSGKDMGDQLLFANTAERLHPDSRNYAKESAPIAETPLPPVLHIPEIQYHLQPLEDNSNPTPNRRVPLVSNQVLPEPEREFEIGDVARFVVGGDLTRQSAPDPAANLALLHGIYVVGQFE